MDSEEFYRLCKTARLKLTEAEASEIGKDVKTIIEYFDKVSDEEASSLDPAFHPIDVKEKLRNDEIAQFGEPDLLINQTKMYRFFVVGPKI
jgi:aspartyl/glutamyl-tRNA(Asn/Gln) amidotransferase C subunit